MRTVAEALWRFSNSLAVATCVCYRFLTMLTNAIRNGLACLALVGLASGCGKAEPEQRTFAKAPASLRAPVAAAAQVDILTDVRTIRPGDAFTAGIRIKLDPEWHTYWKNPGDVGVPTTVDWTLPVGCTAGEIQWPTPVRIVEDDFVTFGYEDEVLLLVPMQTTAALADMSELRLEAAVAWLICKDACMPRDAQVAQVVAVGDAGEEADAATLAIFADARTRLPQPDPGWRFAADITESTVQLHITPPDGMSMAPLDFFPEQQGLIDLAQAPVLETEPSGVTHLTMPRLLGSEPATALRGVLKVGGGAPVALPVEAAWSTP